MPNWCQNEVRVIATDREKVEAFVGFVKEGNNYFSFNKIMPMPNELKGTHSPANIVSQEGYDEWIEATRLSIPLGGDRPITQEMSDRFKKEYGCDNWYDWANDNWGTKWDTACEEAHINDWGGVEYKFDTAWGPPEGIYYALLELFPKLEISWFYREDGMQVAGWLNNGD
jgi:hypothetical protein